MGILLIFLPGLAFAIGLTCGLSAKANTSYSRGLDDGFHRGVRVGRREERAEQAKEVLL